MILRVILLLSALNFLSACELADAVSAVRKMPEKMDNMKGGIDNTSEGLRLQKVGMGVENIEKAENGETLLPYAVDLSSWAKLIAENATLIELLKLQQKWTNKVNEAVYPDFADEQALTDVQKLAKAQKLNHRKDQYISGMILIAGLIPESMVTQIFDHIKGSKELSLYGFSILAMRVEALKDVMITSGYLNRPTEFVGDLEKAVYDAQCIDRLLSVPVPFLNKMKYSFTGYVSEAPGVPAKSKESEMSLEKARSLSVDLWTKLQDTALDQVKVSASANTGDVNEDRALTDRDARRLAEAKNKIDATLAKWSKVSAAPQP